MGLALSTFPNLPASRQTVTLESTQYRVRLTWRHRCQGWYFDLWTLDGTPLLLGRRLSAGWGPNLGLIVENGPTGFLLVRGLDGYAREDLGDSVQLVYYTAAELQAASTTTASEITVTIP
jgi:hypothetical protein